MNARATLIKELEELESSADELRAAALRPLRHALALSLLYSHDVAPDGSDQDKHFRALMRAEPDVFARVQQAFDDHLYVHRRIVDEIVGLAQQRRLLLLTGHAGSGKSTILRRVKTLLPSSDTQSITYINLKDAFDRLLHSQTPAATVCGVVHDHLMQSILMSKPEWKTKLRASYILSDPYFDSIKQQMIADPDITTSQGQTLLEAIAGASTRPVYRRQLQRLWKEWYERQSEQSGTARLRGLLEFLAHEGHHPIILVDNIDRYGLSTQTAVIEKAMDFASATPPLLTPIVAVRTGNFRRLVAESEADYIFFVQRLREAGPLRISIENSTIKEFIRRRLHFALSIMPTDLTSSDDLSRLMTNMGCASAAELLEMHLNALRHLATDVIHVDIIKALTEWHNDSLRGVAAQLLNMVHSMLMGLDPLFLFDGLLKHVGDRTVQEKGIDERRLRTMLYRHMILSNRRPREKLMVLNVFAASESYSPDLMLVMPHDKILWLLLNSTDHQTTFGAVLATMTAFGMRREKCFAVLEELRRPRPYDASGFILIDRAEPKIHAAMDDATRIQLLPAGRFFLRDLSVSCEYLFWMALYCEYWQPRRSVTVKGVASDVFRCFVAAKFAREVVLQQTLAEVESQASAGQVAELCRMFGYAKPRWGFFVERAARSVSVFVRDTRAKVGGAEGGESDGGDSLRRKREEYLNEAAEDLRYILSVCSSTRARLGIQ